METDKRTILLENISEELLGVLNGVQYDNVSYNHNLLQYDELSFPVNKYIDVQEKLIISNFYENIKEMNYVCIPDAGRFKITDVVVENDGYAESKKVSCESCECELNNQNLVNFKINTGEQDSCEYLADDNIDELTGLAKEYVTVYNPNNPQLSLLDLAIEQVPYWKIGYVDPAIRNKKYSFNVDSTPIYSFLMNELSQTAKLIILFDTLKREINVYGIENFDKQGQTDIFVSYRNLLNSASINKSNDGIYTRFNVSGSDDLSIAPVNFNESRIENLFYLLKDIDMYGNPIFVNDEIIRKYEYWYDYRYNENTGKRKDWISLTKQYYQTIIDISDLENRVNADILDYAQYDSFDEETLNQLLKQQIEVVNLLIKYSDCAVYDSEGNMVVDVNGIGIISDMIKFKQSDYYEDYKMYVDIIIPNIKIAIQNLSISVKEDKIKYIDIFETDWNLYGTKELNAKLESYNNTLDVLKDKYSKSWSSLTKDEKSQWVQSDYEIYHHQYVVINNKINACLIALNGTNKSKDKMYKDDIGYYIKKTDNTLYYYDTEWNKVVITETRHGVLLVGRQVELEQKKEEQQNLSNQRLTLIEDVSIKNPKFGFTETELNILCKLRKDSDYVNDNILITSLDNIVTQLDTMEELFQDALKELDIESQPQYNITVDMENIFNIYEYVTPELNENVLVDDDGNILVGDGSEIFYYLDNSNKQKKYIYNRKDFKIGNYIFMGVYDDKTYYPLRILSISYNPFDENETKIEVTFSNMIRSKDGLNDWTSLFNDAITSNLNKIVSTYQKNFDYSSVILSDNLLKAIANSNIFTSNISNLIVDTVSAKEGNIDVLLSNFISTDEFNARLARVENLESESAFIKYLESNLIVSSKIKVEDLEAIFADINSAVIGSAFVNSLGSIASSTTESTAVLGFMKNLIAGDITSLSSSTGLLTIGDGSYGKIIADGSVLQFQDSEGNVYIQVGTDNANKPSLILKDENGNVILNGSGITKDAIVDGLIVNEMLALKSDNYNGISADKLNIDELGYTTLENGTYVVNSANVYYDNKTNSLQTILGNLISSVYEDVTTLTTKYYTKNETANEVNTLIGQTTIVTKDGEVNMKQALNNVINSASEHTQRLNNMSVGSVNLLDDYKTLVNSDYTIEVIS